MPVNAQPHVEVPDWAKDAIWYQVFPERFRNGCPGSSPTVEDISDHPETQHLEGWEVTSWTSDWYQQQAAWEKDTSFYHSIYSRRYGGDLVGVREKLDYLVDLGINAVYFNPLFMASSLHKYEATLFHHIDPTFGPDREGDLALLAKANETEDPATWVWTAADRYFIELLAEMHAKGFKVIIDGVFNHTGRRFFAFQDILRHGRSSPYCDWHHIERWNDDGTFDYKSWFGHGGLPEFGREGDELVPPVRDYLFNVTRRWMDPDGDGDPSDGIDGWRLDVAFCVPKGFWRPWRKLVKSINPEAYLTGELVEIADEYLQGDIFDGVMNYMWLYPSLEFFAPGAKAISANELQSKLQNLLDAYPVECSHVLQNLLDSHDVGRIATMLENPDLPKKTWDDYFESTRAKHKPELRSHRPGDQAYQALRQLTVFQMCYLGAPMIYYGTEVGMWGANDPDNRQPMLWDDLSYEPERYTHNGERVEHPREPDMDLYAFFQQAFTMRKNHAPLRRGTLTWRDEENKRVLSFNRSYEGQTVTAVFNASDHEWPWSSPLDGTDIWFGSDIRAGQELVLPVRGWAVVLGGNA